ncbi:hypothetical protein O181_085071 [Austropuccinia psidii MF-1]|uniref:Integrase catalytic domain-containing protein n=1 Tax=Austropuccinia psidii MF-1 TaxID=1389203 RepID=A0A9Q3FS74_9BASI|nr:hypothetical protein [Austropuccinia psidii MF-1]
MGLLSDNLPCTVCQLNKAHKLPYGDKFKVFLPLDCIHLDLVGPIYPTFVSDFQYLLTIGDQETSFKAVQFIKKKSDTFEELCLAKTFMESKQDCKLKRVVSDQGGGFVNHDFNHLAMNDGFIHIFSPPETSQNNAFSKRGNRKILDKAKCISGGCKLP